MAEGGSQEVRKFTLLLFGDVCVGKTTLISRLISGHFKVEYEPTINYEQREVAFSTTKGEIIFDVFDISGQEVMAKFKAKQHLGAKCALVMFSCTSLTSYWNVQKWFEILAMMRLCQNIPIVICANKSDLKKGRLQRNTITLSNGIPYMEISVKAKDNYAEPFLILARQLLEDPQLEFVKGPALLPPELVLSDEQRKNLEVQPEAPLPSDDEDL